MKPNTIIVPIVIATIVLLLSGEVSGSEFMTLVNYTTNFSTSNPPNWVTIKLENDSAYPNQISFMSIIIPKEGNSEHGGTTFGLRTLPTVPKIPNNYKEIATYNETISLPKSGYYGTPSNTHDFEENTNDISTTYYLGDGKNDTIEIDVEMEVSEAPQEYNNTIYVTFIDKDDSNTIVSELLYKKEVDENKVYFTRIYTSMMYTVVGGNNASLSNRWLNITTTVNYEVMSPKITFYNFTVSKTYYHTMLNVNDTNFSVGSFTNGMMCLNGLTYPVTLFGAGLNIVYTPVNTNSGGGSTNNPPAPHNNPPIHIVNHNNNLWWGFIGAIGLLLPIAYIVYRGKRNICCL